MQNAILLIVFLGFYAIIVNTIFNPKNNLSILERKNYFLRTTIVFLAAIIVTLIVK